MANAPKVRILTYNGVAPTPENVQAGLYPLTVPLGLVWREELSGSSKAFVEFIKTPQAKKILLQNGAIPAE
jgi:phosphate transport system substrate-binding protein